MMLLDVFCEMNWNHGFYHEEKKGCLLMFFWSNQLIVPSHVTSAVAAPMLVNPAQAGHIVGGLELPPLHLLLRACARPAASVPSFWCCGTWWRRLRVDGRSEGAGPTLHGNLGRDRVSPLWVYEDGAVPDDRSRHVHEGVRLVPVYGQPGYAPPGSVHQTLGPRTMTGMTGSGASLVNCHIAMENHNV